MNAKQRIEYWKKIERLRGQLDAKYFEQVRNSIIAQFKRFARDIEAIGVDAARSRIGLDLWDKEMLKIFEAMYKESVILFGNSVYRALKIEANQKAETFGFNREWTDAVLEFLSKQGFVLVADITSTTKKKLLDIVSKGIEEGMGVDEIVRIITSDEQLSYATFRARRIVRTEVMRSSNIGAMKGAEAHPFVVDKEWISARDSRTRRIPQDEFDHVELDGVIVGFDEFFTSTGKQGEQVAVQQPGQLDNKNEGVYAPAGFTINCRCTVAFIPKRDANGRLVMKPKINAPTVPRINTQNVVNQQVVKPNIETRDTIKQKIFNIFKNNTTLNVNNINLSNDLTILELNKRADILEDLSNNYKISEAIDNRYGTLVNFKSTKRTYGFVQHSDQGRFIYEANFGDKTSPAKDRTFDINFTGIREKSRVDLNNLDLATTVHEYGHLLAIREQLYQQYTPKYIEDYYDELKKLNRKYKKEVKEYYIKGDKYTVNQIYLGKYADTNIDEFHAEAFTEYKLSSNPSKYAVLVGQLIDKYFKK